MSPRDLTRVIPAGEHYCFDSDHSPEQALASHLRPIHDRLSAPSPFSHPNNQNLSAMMRRSTTRVRSTCTVRVRIALRPGYRFRYRPHLMGLPQCVGIAHQACGLCSSSAHSRATDWTRQYGASKTPAPRATPITRATRPQTTNLIVQGLSRVERGAVRSQSRTPIPVVHVCVTSSPLYYAVDNRHLQRPMRWISEEKPEKNEDDALATRNSIY